MLFSRATALLLLICSMLAFSNEREGGIVVSERDSISAPAPAFGAKLLHSRTDPGSLDQCPTSDGERAPGAGRPAFHDLGGALANQIAGIPANPPAHSSCRPFSERLPFFATAPPESSST
jgi:hypothetical protein